MSIAESSNGKTNDFESSNEGSTPSSATERNYHAEWYERNKVKRRQQIHERRARMRKEAHEFVCQYLSQRFCIECEENDIVVLDFDHVRGEKKKDVSRLVAEGYTVKSIQEEIDKCDIVCSNCHRRRTAKRAGWHRASYLPID